MGGFPLESQGRAEPWREPEGSRGLCVMAWTSCNPGCPGLLLGLQRDKSRSLEVVGMLNMFSLEFFHLSKFAF